MSARRSFGDSHVARSLGTPALDTPVLGGGLKVKQKITKRKVASPDAKKDRYILQVQAAKGVTPGTVFTSGNPDLLTLKTNHPDVPEIHFKAAYIVN